MLLRWPPFFIILYCCLHSFTTAAQTRTAYLVHYAHTPAAAQLQASGLLRVVKPGWYYMQRVVKDSNIISIDSSSHHWKASQALLHACAQEDSVTVLLGADSLSWPANPLRTGIYSLRIASHQLDSLLALPPIRFADVYRKPVEEMIINTSDMRLNRIALAWQNYPQWQGQGMVISFKESMFDTADIDLLHKHVPAAAEATATSEHATIMTTLAAGRGNSDITGKGVAPLAQLSNADYSTNLLPEPDAYYQDLHIGVQNHSYGTPSIENYYGLEAQAFDAQAWSLDTLLHVFSSGNIGDSVASEGSYAGVKGYANLSGNFKQAKNVLVAGGTDADNNVPLPSSKGPAYDGRIKPDIVAYGQDGTSGAAALCSGVATLLQQACAAQYGHRPGAALVKGLLINSATDIGNPGPNYSSGYGALHAARALQTLQDGHFREAQVSAGGSITLPLQIPAGTGALKVTLVWNDPPAQANATQALVNDLDLQVITPGGVPLLPWVLTNINAPAIRGRDSLNNVEQVTLEPATAGTYSLVVNATHLHAGTQRFYVVYSFAPAQYFTWEYPLRSSKPEAATTLPLHWSSAGYSTGDISYSLDRGNTWKILASGIPLAKDGYTWTLPDTFCTAILKMESAAQAFLSDTFVISPQPTLHVGFDCSDAGQLWWHAQPGADSYLLAVLDYDSLKSYVHTRDTALVIPGDGPSYFSLQAISPRGDTGLRSLTYNYHQQGLQCYIQSLNADSTAQGVLLQLQLGTVYHLKSIRWERLTSKGFITLQEERIQDGLAYYFTDTSRLTGIVYYRVTLVTEDGKNYTSDEVAVNLLGPHDYWLFPNPAQVQFQFFSKTTEQVQLQLYNSSGILVLQRNINMPQTTIPVNGLPAGIYVCAIFDHGRRVGTQKLVILPH